MKNKIGLLVFIVALFMFIPTVQASTSYAMNEKCTYRKCTIRTQANEAGDWLVTGMIQWLDPGDVITLVDGSKIKSTSDKCSTDYYYVTYAGKNGYVCGDYINFSTDGKYYNELRTAGFPESYLLSLNALKEQHPNWVFTAYKTGLDWNLAIASQSIVGKSYIQSNNPIYLSLDGGSYNQDSKTYNMMETGGWYAANKQTVAYYMDARNFLNIYDIFMFENLGYNSSYQTKDVIQKMFSNTDLLQYADYYMEAATSNGNSISPIFLGARSRQEIVKSDGSLSDSANGSGGVYNFYNLGAKSSCSNPVQCGLTYAANRGWNDARTAIIGGATEIANGYINQNQNTLYFQKFNVTGNVYGNHSHQYMTNIMAPKSEGRATYDGYSSIPGLLNSSIGFVIPVYENMPTSAVNLPTSVNQDEVDKINNPTGDNNLSASSIVNGAGYRYDGTYASNINAGTKVEDFINKLQGIGGTVTLTRNGNKMSGNEVLGTGDVVVVSSNSKTEELRVIVYGDVSGDGNVTVVDLLKVQKNILGTLGLSNEYYKSADVNKDGQVTVLDLLLVQKHILGLATITQ